MKKYGETTKWSIDGYFILPSAKFNLPSKCGKAKNMLRNTRKKRLLRILTKRIKRQRLKREINNILKNND
jgi:hypothetical protein